jgi:hypothetical protein
MAVANRMTGKDLYIEWVYSGGTVNLTGDARSFEVTREQEVADVTAGADGARSSKATVKNFGASAEILYTGTAGSATFGVLDLGSEGTLRYYPQGTATGKPKGAFPAIVTNVGLALPYDDAAVLTVEWMGQGDEVWTALTDVV